ncbi:hypothetical protein EDB85DRAFT_1888125 [Lactarius pseudohatsudake]|nr:hypothetical protein EDB85DRAFT_1888125 [Lactarius pseudohatsudake]
MPPASTLPHWHYLDIAAITAHPNPTCHHHGVGSDDNNNDDRAGSDNDNGWAATTGQAAMVTVVRCGNGNEGLVARKEHWKEAGKVLGASQPACLGEARMAPVPRTGVLAYWVQYTQYISRCSLTRDGQDFDPPGGCWGSLVSDQPKPFKMVWVWRILAQTKWFGFQFGGPKTGSN